MKNKRLEACFTLKARTKQLAGKTPQEGKEVPPVRGLVLVAFMGGELCDRVQHIIHRFSFQADVRAIDKIEIDGSFKNGNGGDVSQVNPLRMLAPNVEEISVWHLFNRCGGGWWYHGFRPK